MKEKIGYIIRRGSVFLVAIAYYDSKTPRWSNSAWDAVRIPRREEADRLADYFGGEVLTFSNLRGVTE